MTASLPVLVLFRCKPPQFRPVKYSGIWNNWFGVPPIMSSWDFRIRSVFQKIFNFSKSLWSILEKEYHVISLCKWLPVRSLPSVVFPLKKLMTHPVKLLLYWTTNFQSSDLQLKIHICELQCFLSALIVYLPLCHLQYLRQFWVSLDKIQIPWPLQQKKHARLMGLLFDLQDLSQGVFWENPSTALWIGNPGGFILS